jgi:diguanylate cyclase (GGDEF)-like protein
MSKPIQEERPYLSKIINLQKITSELDLQLHKQISGEVIDNWTTLQQIDKILSEVGILTSQKVIDDNDLKYLHDFADELTRLKVALVYFKENKIYDPASSSTEELFEIIDESVIKINRNLNHIISIIRRQIADSDEKVLAGTQFIQKSLLSFLAMVIIGTLVVLYFFNLILSANLKKLITGTIQLGEGNFAWRIKSKFDDEFGQLSIAFNTMAEKIAESKQEIVAQTEKIKQLAYYDQLTKLPSRSAFLDKLKQELARAKRNNEKLSVLYLDLDDFKMVNDSFGHDMGDFLLEEVAARMMRNSRLTDTLGRMGGDEFALILPNLNFYTDSSNIGQRIIDEISCPVSLGNRIIDELSQPFAIKNNILTISCSIGIAVYPENGITADEILNSADTAMYSAKKEGKNRVKYCTEEMTTRMHNLLEFEHELRRALINGEFVLHFQPQVDLVKKEIIGLEALIRWHHPQRGLISPDEFIPLAEERGIIQDISKWVIRYVFDQLKLWQDAGCRLVPVMVNLSARDFFQQGIENYIVAILKEEEEFRGMFGIEVTETGIMVDRESATTTLNKLKEMGLKIAIDDFGTGYSSLNYLQSLPLDIVKIDRSFVANITQDSTNAAIIEAIVLMSHTLNLKVLAEGVETPEQYEFLRNIQCDLAQGYLFHKPLPADEICNLLDEHPV